MSAEGRAPAEGTERIVGGLEVVLVDVPIKLPQQMFLHGEVSYCAATRCNLFDSVALRCNVWSDTWA